MELEVDIEKRRMKSPGRSRNKIEKDRLFDIFEHLENNIPKII